MDLKQLTPKQSTIKLRAFKEPIKLRPITLSDEAWLDETYGEAGILSIFESMNMIEISRIVFRLICDKDKPRFKSREVQFILEDGSETTQTIGGVNLFMQSISGQQEKVAVFTALLENIGFSRPQIDQMEDGEPAQVKKKTKARKKTKKKS